MTYANKTKTDMLLFHVLLLERITGEDDRLYGCEGVKVELHLLCRQETTPTVLTVLRERSEF